MPWPAPCAERRRLEIEQVFVVVVAVVVVDDEEASVAPA